MSLFKEFCISQTQNIIKDNPKYENNLNNTLKLIDAIAQSMNEPKREIYPYLPLT